MARSRRQLKEKTPAPPNDTTNPRHSLGHVCVAVRRPSQQELAEPMDGRSTANGRRIESGSSAWVQKAG